MHALNQAELNTSNRRCMHSEKNLHSEGCISKNCTFYNFTQSATKRSGYKMLRKKMLRPEMLVQCQENDISGLQTKTKIT